MFDKVKSFLKINKPSRLGFLMSPSRLRPIGRSGVKVGGHLLIIDDRTSRILVDQHNLVVNAGLTHIRDRMSGLATVPDAMSYLGVGSSATGPCATDTDCGTPIGSRAAATVTEPTSYAVKYAYTASGGVWTGSWAECGVFNASSGSTMLCRAVFGTLTKGTDDSFTIEYTTTYSDDGV